VCSCRIPWPDPPSLLVCYVSVVALSEALLRLALPSFFFPFSGFFSPEFFLGQAAFFSFQELTMKSAVTPNLFSAPALRRNAVELVCDSTNRSSLPAFPHPVIPSEVFLYTYYSSTSGLSQSPPPLQGIASGTFRKRYHADPTDRKIATRSVSRHCDRTGFAFSWRRVADPPLAPSPAYKEIPSDFISVFVCNFFFSTPWD